ncbi:phosphoglycerate mutase family protein [Apodospora peruviana]|uniref:Phosphoglycerate mutase family protein n=1 Tax=Apodospora peruviana TaxID=516989 RepID=A0AAE0M1E1_9PEZI|nr:phosphoglycerate mutase family protein [Apodospora peruviana]
MSPTVIYLIRHAESDHNVTKDFSLRDPGLTDLGFAQASSASPGLPLPSISVILASPLRRTIETTLAMFKPVIGEARLILDPNLQERSNLPCDTGSEVTNLKERFPSSVDFSGLGEGWFAKEGAFTADDQAVAARAKVVRKRLYQLSKEVEGTGKGKSIAVVTHGVFMKFLTEDEGIDLPKAGWRAYTAVADEGGKDGEVEVKLVAVE